MTDPSRNYGREDPHQQPYTQPYTQSQYSQYSQQQPQQYGQEPQRQMPHINLGRLWAGGVGTAVVVALVIVVAIMLVRGILKCAVLSREAAGASVTVSTTSSALAGAAAAIAATGLLNLLLAFMPSPMQFYYWITGLLTALAVLLPFTLVADLDAK